MCRMFKLISILLIIVVGCTNAPKGTKIERQGNESNGTVQSLNDISAVLGKQVPDVALTDLDGKSVGLRKLLDGESVKLPTILIFSTTTCPYCTDENIELQKVKSTFGESIRILTILVKETPSSAGEFLKDNQIPGTVLVDPKAEASTVYKIELVPTILLLDSDGYVNYIGNFTPERDITELMTRIQQGERVSEVRPGSG